jgi:metal-responsive CopG/Arc/MetJ family transcriptional regulator
MFKKKITIEKDLFERAARFAQDKGYSDLSEWISDLMEEEMKRNQGGGPEGDKDEEEIKKKLQGLGYIS